MKSLSGEERGGLYYHKASGRRGSESAPHYHSECEVYYLTEGRCNYFIGERPYEVIPGDIVFIPPEEIHRTNYGKELNGRIVINFDIGILSEALRKKVCGLARHYRDKRLSSAVSMLLYEIGEEYSSPTAEGVVEGLLSALISMLLRRGEEGSLVGGGGSVSRAAEYIKENYMHEVRLSCLADLYSVSAEHLSREFKRSVGLGFSEYLTLYRLKRANEMLINEPSRSVAEVAFASGFNDGNYFSYKFKKEYGVTPSFVKKNAVKKR